MPAEPRPRTALLLMDLQEAILQNYPDEGLLERIRTALGAARRASLPVVWVRVCFRAGYPEVSPRNIQFSNIRQAGRLREDDPRSAIHPSLEIQPRDVWSPNAASEPSPAATLKSCCARQA